MITGMMEGAIKFCASKTGLKDRKQILESMRRGDCSVCEFLRYGLAKAVADYLGSMDENVRAIYTYEPEYAASGDGSLPDRPISSPGISMIAWVSRKSAALSSVVASVSSALAGEYKRLACPRVNALCYDLDVAIADDDEVRRRIGYGALIGSLNVRPIEVWRR